MSECPENRTVSSSNYHPGCPSCATITARLAEVEREREQLKAGQRSMVEDIDAVVGKYADDVCYQEAEYGNFSWSRVMAERLKVLFHERDTLRADLAATRDGEKMWHDLACKRGNEITATRAVLERTVEALRTVNPWCMVSHKHVTCDLGKVNAALADPALAAALEEVA